MCAGKSGSVKSKSFYMILIMKGGLKDEILGVWRVKLRKKKSAFYDRLAELSERIQGRYESLIDRRKIDVKELKDLIIYIEDSDEIYKGS